MKQFLTYINILDNTWIMVIGMTETSYLPKIFTIANMWLAWIPQLVASQSIQGCKDIFIHLLLDFQVILKIMWNLFTFTDVILANFQEMMPFSPFTIPFYQTITSIILAYLQTKSNISLFFLNFKFILASPILVSTKVYEIYTYLLLLVILKSHWMHEDNFHKFMIGKTQI